MLPFADSFTFSPMSMKSSEWTYASPIILLVFSSRPTVEAFTSELPLEAVLPKISSAGFVNVMFFPSTCVVVLVLLPALICAPSPMTTPVSYQESTGWLESADFASETLVPCLKTALASPSLRACTIALPPALSFTPSPISTLEV